MMRIAANHQGGPTFLSAMALALLLLPAVAPLHAEEAAPLLVTIDSLTVPTFFADPHPPFRERAVKLADSAGSALEWGGFDAAALICKGPDPQSAFAVKRESGVSVFLLNEGDAPRPYRAQVKLARGLYSVEELVQPGVGDVLPRRSLALAKAGDRAILGTIPPKSISAIRFTNAVDDAETKIQAVLSRLYGSRLSTGRKKRIVNCLNETHGKTERVDSRLGKTDRANLARDMHRGMLTASQADAMLRNAALQGDLTAVSKQKLVPDLLAMQSALSAVSAGCFDLLPMVSVEPPTEADSPTMLVLTLVNRGTQSVKLVSFSVSPPAGWTSSAIGCTLFAELGSGQSLSGRFALGAPSDAVPGSAVVIPGDISYFAHHAAAHLKVSATIGALSPAGEGGVVVKD